MQQTTSFERRLLHVLLGIGIVAVLGVAAIVPYRMYDRDIRNASVQAHRISALVHASLSHALIHESDITDLTNRFQSLADLEIRLEKLTAGEIHPAASSGRGWSQLDGTELNYITPPILDGRGDTWLASMHFDLSPMKRSSIRLIVDLMLAVVIGATLFSVTVFLLIRRSILQPLRDLTRALSESEPGAEARTWPVFQTREMANLAEALRTATRAGRSHG
jgi:signal transduction histidine kinase